MKFEIKPIGIIHTPFKKPGDAPIQASRSKETGTVEVFKEYLDGLDDIEGFSHIFLLYRFHLASSYSLKSKPFLDDKEKGVFAIRTPRRPNHIGLSVVELIKREGNILHVRGVDMLDGSPLIDIKPYVPKFDHRDNVRFGWLEGKL
jgi:tRNA-Thr(GGU) m(6)t(6)A37 methyltransferase TsaA